MQPNCLHDNPALTQSGHAAGWGSHGPTQRSPSNCTCPGSYLPQRLGGAILQPELPSCVSKQGQHQGELRCSDSSGNPLICMGLRCGLRASFRERGRSEEWSGESGMWPGTANSGGGRSPQASAGAPKNTREPARSGKKKPQPRTVGVSLLVEPAGIEPASVSNPPADLHA